MGVKFFFPCLAAVKSSVFNTVKQSLGGQQFSACKNWPLFSLPTKKLIFPPCYLGEKFDFSSRSGFFFFDQKFPSIVALVWRRRRSVGAISPPSAASSKLTTISHTLCWAFDSQKKNTGSGTVENHRYRHPSKRRVKTSNEEKSIEAKGGIE